MERCFSGNWDKKNSLSIRPEWLLRRYVPKRDLKKLMLLCTLLLLNWKVITTDKYIYINIHTYIIYLKKDITHIFLSFGNLNWSVLHKYINNYFLVICETLLRHCNVVVCKHHLRKTSCNKYKQTYQQLKRRNYRTAREKQQNYDY